MGIMNQMKEKFFAEGHTLPTCVNQNVLLVHLLVKKELIDLVLQDIRKIIVKIMMDI